MAKYKTQIDYTLEQFQAEVKHREKTIKTLEKMASVMEKFESLGILHDHRISKLEKRMEKNG